MNVLTARKLRPRLSSRQEVAKLRRQLNYLCVSKEKATPCFPGAVERSVCRAKECEPRDFSRSGGRLPVSGYAGDLAELRYRAIDRGSIGSADKRRLGRDRRERIIFPFALCILLQEDG